MASKKQIVCIGFPKWEGDYMKSTVSLMSELAKIHDVLYVDYPYTWKDLVFRALGRDTTASVTRILGLQPRLRSQRLSGGQTIHLLTLPPFIPANWTSSERTYDRLLGLNGSLAQRAILKAMTDLQFERPIVINAFNPALGNALQNKLGEECLVYYCYDEISAAQWINKHGSRHEKEFLSEVDLTIVTSTGLLNTKTPDTSDCVLVKNGVSLNLFRGDIARISKRRPRIGYLGSLDERVDLSLLEHLIQTFPVWEFQFVGRIVLPDLAEQLKRFPNVAVLGAQPLEDLGGIVAGYDVGLIPFKKNELTAGIYPLKINEYLAMGTPVVSTDFADLSDFEDVAFVGRTPDEFAGLIQEALLQNDDEAIERRKAFARSNSWAARATAFDDALDQVLAAKSGKPIPLEP